MNRLLTRILLIAFSFSLFCVARSAAASLIIDHALVDGTAQSYCVNRDEAPIRACTPEVDACKAATVEKFNNIIQAYCSGINPEICTVKGDFVYEFTNKSWGELIQPSLDLFFWIDPVIKTALNCPHDKKFADTIVGSNGEDTITFNSGTTGNDVITFSNSDRVVDIIKFGGKDTVVVNPGGTDGNGDNNVPVVPPAAAPEIPPAPAAAPAEPAAPVNPDPVTGKTEPTKDAPAEKTEVVEVAPNVPVVVADNSGNDQNEANGSAQENPLSSVVNMGGNGCSLQLAGSNVMDLGFGMGAIAATLLSQVRRRKK